MATTEEDEDWPMQEPPWMPRTEEEYRQQVAEDAGPQPDEMVRVQQALDATEEEVARLQMVRDAAEREIERLTTLSEQHLSVASVAMSEVERLWALRPLLADFVETLTIGRVAEVEWYDLRDRALAQAQDILATLEGKG